MYGSNEKIFLRWIYRKKSNTKITDCFLSRWPSSWFCFGSGYYPFSGDPHWRSYFWIGRASQGRLRNPSSGYVLLKYIYMQNRNRCLRLGVFTLFFIASFAFSFPRARLPFFPLPGYVNLCYYVRRCGCAPNPLWPNSVIHTYFFYQ